MKCPACSEELANVRQQTIELNVCSNGCGGVWFDEEELLSCDEETEPVGQDIIRPLKNKKVIIDHNKTRRCPRCHKAVLLRKLYDAERSFEIDECPACSGVWLDLGELDLLREDNHLQKEQKQAFEEYLLKHLKGKSISSLPENIQAVFRLLF